LRPLAAAASAAPAAALPEGVTCLPLPSVAASPQPGGPNLVHVDLEAREVTGLIADGVGYHFWTFNGSVPGPMMRVRQGDTVEIALHNAPDSLNVHSINLHAATGPGGGASLSQVAPAGESTFRFQALHPGVYVYHCMTPMVGNHVANGMYGMVVVEPPNGWSPVDREFYLMQGRLLSARALQRAWPAGSRPDQAAPRATRVRGLQRQRRLLPGRHVTLRAGW